HPTSIFQGRRCSENFMMSWHKIASRCVLSAREGGFAICCGPTGLEKKLADWRGLSRLRSSSGRLVPAHNLRADSPSSLLTSFYPALGPDSQRPQVFIHHTQSDLLLQSWMIDTFQTPSMPRLAYTKQPKHGDQQQ